MVTERIHIAESNPDLQTYLAEWRASDERIALIPTMGALHYGHLAHIPRARASAHRVVVSIFVNPEQFAPNEDFDRYPRDLTSDVKSIERAGGVDLIYAPQVDDIYSEAVQPTPVLDGPAKGLESDFRPHFFGGVVAVVERLFEQVKPECATFGEKDYQQLLVVKDLVQRRGLETEIISVPIVREHDGLALSSRNKYLSVNERAVAPQLYETLRQVAQRVRSGHGVPESEAEGIATLLSRGFDRVDYCTVRNPNSLRPIHEFTGSARVLAAAWLGTTRLIDNLAIK